MSEKDQPLLRIGPTLTMATAPATTAPRPPASGPRALTPVSPLRELPARRWKLATTRLLMVLSVLASIRYFWWRVLQSYNPAAKWFFYLFLVAELMNWLEAGLFYFTCWKPTRWAPLAPLTGRTVDVFIATYNEPLELLRETTVCAVSMRYPHQTYLLDDGSREQVRELAREFNCGYLARRDRTHAKAGNLNNALKQTTGEFIITLDADHIPMPDFIDQVIGFFADPEVAVVQTPQDFYNLDSFHHHTDWRDQYAWHQQEIFYGVIQPGKDRYNATFYCGSPAMIRRAALQEIGGFATETITEDMHTGMRLQKNGWRVLYYNRTVARGLGPQTYNGFATQWRRWGVGAMQVLRTERIFWRSNLTVCQRVCYFCGFYFYWLGYQKLVFIATPILSLLLGLFPILAGPSEFVRYFGPHFALNMVTLAILQGGFRSFLLSEQFNIIKVHVLMSTIVGLFRAKHQFKVTPKSQGQAPRWIEVWPQIVMLGFTNAALVVGALRLYRSAPGYQFWALMVNLFWAGFFLCLAAGILWRALRQRELRGTYRFPSHMDVPVQIRLGRVSEEYFARNLNRTGFSVTRDQAFEIGRELDVSLRLPTGLVICAAGRVMRNQAYRVGNTVRVSSGIRFERIAPQDQDEISKYLFWEVAPKHGAILRLTRMTQQEGLT